jgi:hypothetical protein
MKNITDRKTDRNRPFSETLHSIDETPPIRIAEKFGRSIELLKY